MTEPEKQSVHLPAPTAWPLVFGVGVALMGAAFVISYGFFLAAVPVFVIGLGGWISEMLPGRGHHHEPFADERPRPIEPRPGAVEPLKPGTAGYRFSVPEKVHPISSGAKGGVVGGIAMIIPALAGGQVLYGSIWVPVNLLAGMVFPGIAEATQSSLAEFNMLATVTAVVIHIAFSITFGLMYGVILPMLPPIPGGSLIYGGFVMPIIWSGVCYGLIGVVNPPMADHINWPWFVLAQFVYGIAMSWVVFRTQKVAVSQKGGAPRE